MAKNIKKMGTCGRTYNFTSSISNSQPFWSIRMRNVFSSWPVWSRWSTFACTPRAPFNSFQTSRGFCWSWTVWLLPFSRARHSLESAGSDWSGSDFSKIFSKKNFQKNSPQLSHAYFRDRWCQFDFVLLLFHWASWLLHIYQIAATILFPSLRLRYYDWLGVIRCIRPMIIIRLIRLMLTFQVPRQRIQQLLKCF